MRDPVDRFLGKVDLSLLCWNWLGAVSSSGYGCFQVDSHRVASAHRFAYEHFVGRSLPASSSTTSAATGCALNPDHLEPVTHAENLRRGRFAREVA